MLATRKRRINNLIAPPTVLIVYFTYQNSIINIAILGVHVFVQLTAAVLIYIKRHEPNDRSWKYIFVFFTASSVASMGEILITMGRTAMLDTYKLMNPYIIIPGFVIFSLLMFYLIECMSPHWCTLKRITLICLPWLLLVGIFSADVMWNGMTVLYRINDIAEHKGEFDVWVRLALSLLFIPYALWLCFLRYQWRLELRKRPLLVWLLVLTCLLCLTYLGSRGLQLFPMYIAHEVLYLALTILILYVTYYERLHIPIETVKSYYTPKPIGVTPSEGAINHAVESLRALMEDESVWADAELTRDHLIQLAATNRTYAQVAAKKMGFEGIMDMLHHRRVDYICKQLRENPQVNIQSLFFDAGYRSRATGWRHFTEIVGCTPTEFIEKNITPPQ